MVNGRICENISSQTVEMAAEEAFQSGAMALFEKMVTVSGWCRWLISARNFAVEPMLKIPAISVSLKSSQTSVASGIRRIEALTGKGDSPTHRRPLKYCRKPPAF